jgi:GT2 family glycosyltransferase
MGRVTLDGKQFACHGERFAFRGVTYGTFRPRDVDGARFPDIDQVKLDLADMAAAGFSVVRTYTTPPPDLLDAAADFGLHVLAGVYFDDWRYLVGCSRRQRWQMLRQARETVATAARALAAREEVLGICIANEVPADVVRWVGQHEIGLGLRALADVVHEVDDRHLATYANYPTAEYLKVDGLDFLTFNVFLEHQNDFRRYLTRLQHLAGERPLVLGEVGLHAPPGAAGENHQAEVLDWQLTTAVERGVAGTCVFSWTDEWWVGDAAVEGWHFGLTRADRSPRPALAVAERWNSRSVADLAVRWPSISVVVCAYNAASTIGECLEHTCRLEYPGLEVIVVDDGSTDATADITRRFPRARLVTIEHAGLSVARNEGLRQAAGELVAYLDSDAYPTPEWPYFLATAMDGSTVGGVGGPNLPPPSDPPGAHRVAASPGGPVHVLVGDDRAEHVPGCNMAFWRDVLIEAGGFDPIYTAAGDDVDICWKVLDRGWEIGFHPAALVWHHRRPGAAAYLRQQRGYGRAEALVAARHPDRFTSAGTARWRGLIYTPSGPAAGRQRIYRGLYGAASFQSVYRDGGHSLDLAHQLGVPVAAGLLVAAPLAFLWPAVGLVPVAAVLAMLALGIVDATRACPPPGSASQRLGFRLGVAGLHLLQPLARTWGRMRHRRVARRDLPASSAIPSPVTALPGGALLVPETVPRTEIASSIVVALRTAGFGVVTATGWEDHDATVLGSVLVAGELVTSSHPAGSVQIRVRRRPRHLWAVTFGLLTALLLSMSVTAGAVVAALLVLDACVGVWRTGPLLRRRIRRLAG